MRVRATAVLSGSLLLASPLALVAAAQSSRPAAPPRVPLRAGLTIVTAVNQPEHGDYESLKVIERADATGVRLKYSTDVPDVEPSDNPLAALLGGPKPQAATPAEGGKTREIRTTRVIARADLETATE